MSDEPETFRNTVLVAARTFRPVLKGLSLRDPSKHRPVYIAAYPHLDFLKLDNCIINVLTADLKNCMGIFASGMIDGLLQNYIVLDKSLFELSEDDTVAKKTKEMMKLAGVHEFCHFMAIMYCVTATSIEEARTHIMKRLRKKIDMIRLPNLFKIYSAVQGALPQDYTDIDELSDQHFRLDGEGSTPDYVKLFAYFLLSPDIFNTVFTEEKQNEFRSLILSDQTTEAANVYVETVREIAMTKDIPFKLALSQALPWISLYLEE
jgi:hypothetical protein